MNEQLFSDQLLDEVIDEVHRQINENYDFSKIEKEYDRWNDFNDQLDNSNTEKNARTVVRVSIGLRNLLRRAMKKLDIKDPNLLANAGLDGAILKDIKNIEADAKMDIEGIYKKKSTEPQQDKKDNDGNEQVDEPGEKASEQPKDNKETESSQMYDPEPELRKRLVSAYKSFKNDFYNQRTLAKQGELVRDILDVLSDMQEKESDEAEGIKGKTSDIGTIPESKDEEVKPEKKDISILKAHLRSFYQDMLDSKKKVRELANLTKDGKVPQAASFLEKQLMEILADIQSGAVELDEDFSSLISKPPEQPKEIEEAEFDPAGGDSISQKATSFLSRYGLAEVRSAEEKADRMLKVQAAYDNVVEGLFPIVQAIAGGQKVAYQAMTAAVKKSMDTLKDVLIIFPNIKPFAGDLDHDEAQEQYSKAIDELDFDVSNIQSILKGESIKKGMVRRLSRNLKTFSSRVESIFGVKSQFVDKPKPDDSPIEDPDEDKKASAPQTLSDIWEGIDINDDELSTLKEFFEIYRDIRSNLSEDLMYRMIKDEHGDKANQIYDEVKTKLNRDQIKTLAKLMARYPNQVKESFKFTLSNINKNKEFIKKRIPSSEKRSDSDTFVYDSEKDEMKPKKTKKSRFKRLSKLLKPFIKKELREI